MTKHAIAQCSQRFGLPYEAAEKTMYKIYRTLQQTKPDPIGTTVGRTGGTVRYYNWEINGKTARVVTGKERRIITVYEEDGSDLHD